MSQTALARVIGVSQPTVSDWESTKTDPTTENMSMAAITLHVRFEWLATGRGEKQYVEGAQEDRVPYRVEELHPDQMDLLKIYLKLKPGHRQALLEFLKKWS